MGDRFSHARHIVRAAALLALGLVLFLIARSTLIPSDFGVYGYYRAGALDDIRSQPIAYAGRASCDECHDGAYDPPEPDDESPVKKPPLEPLTAKDNKHAPIRCEACHGPLQKHIDDTEKDVPKITTGDGLCLGCHRQIAGRPKSQPQVVATAHKNDDARTKDGCISCHPPHWPKIAGTAGFFPVGATPIDPATGKPKPGSKELSR